MINKAILCLIACVFFMPYSVHAQDINAQGIIELVEKGDKAYLKEDYSKALSYYNLADKGLGNDPGIDKRIGVTLFKLNRFNDAMPVLKGVRDHADTTDIYVDFYLAVSLHKIEKYDEAIEIYESCLDYINIKSLDTGEEEIKKIIREVQSDRKNIELSKFKIDKPENRE
ncbi:MAG: hypothetical protein HC905_04320 [Bacteroidales bacterium]|nr:hypothetical protein [Bacteroidales bacterium]